MWFFRLFLSENSQLHTVHLYPFLPPGCVELMWAVKTAGPNAFSRLAGNDGFSWTFPNDYWVGVMDLRSLSRPPAHSSVSGPSKDPTPWAIFRCWLMKIPCWVACHRCSRLRSFGAPWVSTVLLLGAVLFLADGARGTGLSLRELKPCAWVWSLGVFSLSVQKVNSY